VVSSFQRVLDYVEVCFRKFGERIGHDGFKASPKKERKKKTK